MRSAAARFTFWVCVLGGIAALVGQATAASSDEEDLGLPETPIELATLPERPRPIVELGNDYLAPSPISEGWTLPTGAVWQPSVLVWGALRTAIQGEDGRAREIAEWANRLDLFGQLSLTQTERIVVSIEPFQDGPEFTGFRFPVDGAGAEFVSGFDFDPDTLFFEGDLGELLPHLDRASPIPLDLGMMVGRVPVVFQDGFLIDDRLTAFGLVQNSIVAGGTSNLRISGLVAWDGVHRGNNVRSGTTLLTGLFAEFDRMQTTWALDAIYVNGNSQSDGLFGGVSAIRRLGGRWNLTARVLGSYALDREGPQADDGLLGVLGISVAPRGTHDVAYLNLVASAGRYVAAARGPERGGPLGRVGILFEAPGLGSVPTALSNATHEMFAAALGYHKFLSEGRTQIVVEVGGRTRHGRTQRWAAAGGVRIQQALGRRLVVRADGYGGFDRAQAGFGGGRAELVVKF